MENAQPIHRDMMKGIYDSFFPYDMTSNFMGVECGDILGYTGI